MLDSLIGAAIVDPPITPVHPWAWTAWKNAYSEPARGTLAERRSYSTDLLNTAWCTDSACYSLSLSLLSLACSLLFFVLSSRCLAACIGFQRVRSNEWSSPYRAVSQVAQFSSFCLIRVSRRELSLSSLTLLFATRRFAITLLNIGPSSRNYSV